MRSSTDSSAGALSARVSAAGGSWSDAARDLGHLLRFRSRTVRRRRAAVVASVLLILATVAFATFPSGFESRGAGAVAEMADTATAGLRSNLALVFLAVLVLAIAAAMAGGGGRELLSRTEAMIHPISPVTEHLGALVLAPSNLAWLVQAWTILAATALVVDPGLLAGAQLVALLWLVVATAAGQAVGWAVEGVRRTTHGVVIVRATSCLIGLGFLALHLLGRLDDVARAMPTTWLVETAGTTRWPLAAVVLLVLAPLSVWLGAVPARWALALPPREELRVESGVHEARHLPRPRWISPELALMIRLDRASVWRSVGMRRGLIVLGVGPGAVAFIGGLSWTAVLMLPGLAASGAALLFGVNAWCLDGKGMVWRETLPVAPSVVFNARALVTAECMVLVSTITIAIATLRNGLPPLPTVVALLMCWLVVVMQVLATSLKWSVRRPFGVDLSSPRATPAPHAVMAGYAGRLSLSTTFTGLFFSSLLGLLLWWLTPVFALPFLIWSGLRLFRARRRWLVPSERAQIVLTVAAV